MDFLSALAALLKDQDADQIKAAFKGDKAKPPQEGSKEEVGDIMKDIITPGGPSDPNYVSPSVEAAKEMQARGGRVTNRAVNDAAAAKSAAKKSSVADGDADDVGMKLEAPKEPVVKNEGVDPLNDIEFVSPLGLAERGINKFMQFGRDQRNKKIDPAPAYDLAEIIKQFLTRPSIQVEK